MHAVGELDDKHAHVTTHGHDHFADGFGLCGIAVFHLGKLGHAVHQAGDGVAEFGAAFVKRVIGVFDGVVQQTGGDHARPHAQIGEDLRDRERMNDVRFAGFAPLRGVLDDGTLVGAFEDRHILAWMMHHACLHDGQQRVYGVGADLAAQFSRGIELHVVVFHTCLSNACSITRERLHVITACPLTRFRRGG